MNFLFINLASVSVYGIAYVNSVDHIVQHMDKEHQHHKQQHPWKNSYKVWVNPKIASTLQDGTHLHKQKSGKMISL